MKCRAFVTLFNYPQIRIAFINRIYLCELVDLCVRASVGVYVRAFVFLTAGCYEFPRVEGHYIPRLGRFVSEQSMTCNKATWRVSTPAGLLSEPDN
jgi:hypothetical protein